MLIACIVAYTHTYIHTPCIPACRQTHVSHIHRCIHPVCLRACVSACLRGSVPACLPARVPACPATCPPALSSPTHQAHLSKAQASKHAQRAELSTENALCLFLPGARENLFFLEPISAPQCYSTPQCYISVRTPPTVPRPRPQALRVHLSDKVMFWRNQCSILFLSFSNQEIMSYVSCSGKRDRE